jgi:hypothetical protein
MVLRVVSRGMVSGRLLACQALPAHDVTQNPAAPATETSIVQVMAGSRDADLRLFSTPLSTEAWIPAPSPGRAA